ncbi:bifunctional serine/threonine-protein kinase/ABC transporter substrate-binding protein [Pendulispora brunnea]|uniref:Bifunctional serine/threonine-protein kinase/ABC transporter substrate-binding protein n=1 Tax=Pendulispora brunnea TaxID=2905690 RepID=A0ABZ2KEW7_9BACT
MNQSRAAGKHRLLIELGRGGMGTVYLATRRDQVAERPALVVVKHLRAELASHLRFLQGFLDESHLAMRLDHPNIVRTWDVGFEARHYFLEMEYLEGQTLDVLMRTAASSKDGLPWAVGIFALEQVLAGLHYAHELTDAHGRPLAIVHRDVSPHNVLVTYDGAVKLLDFGIAKAAISSHETSTGIIKGKITYMAPEQAGRRNVDRRADIFSVGVMLWQCLTGQRLWADVPEPLLFHKLDRGEIDPPRTLRPDVPEALEAICMKALALDPAQRYTTAEELRVALSHERRTRWGEVGRVELARTMIAYFAERRAADKAQIDARLAARADESFEVLPVLGQAPSLPVIALGIDPAGRTSTGTRTEPHHGNSKTVRRRRVPRWAAVAMGAAVAAVAGAAGIGLASRARTHPAAEATQDAPVLAGCTSNAACVRQNDGHPYICRKSTDGACVSLEAPGCKVLAEKGDIENDATIWFGAMFPMSGKNAEAFGLESVNTVDLARRDFVQIARGIPSPAPGKPARPIGIIACDDAVNPKEAARHLVDLQVPAVIGFTSSQEVIDLATESFIPNGILAVATQNRSSLITTIPHPPYEPRLVWRTTFNTAVNMIPVSAVVAEVIEPSLRASHVLKPDEPMRVVHLRIRNTTGLSGSDALLGTLRFNGKSAVENGSNYLELLYTNPQDPRPIADSSIVDALLKFRPHVIISAGFDTNTKTVLAPLETRWPRSEGFRPRYVVAGMYGDDFFQLLGKNAERRRRFLGVGLPTSTLVNAKLTMHYNETYTPKVTQSGAPGAVYDAVYLLAYAAYAMGDLPMTGSNLARGIGRLVPPGEPIDVGPTKIFEAFRLLQEGKSIDLRGAATPLDFDLATGESPIDFALLCVGTDEHGMANEAIEPGPIFRAATKRIEGLPLRCP